MRATIKHGGEAARVVYDRGLKVSGPARVATWVEAFWMAPHAAYNPALGGAYEGYDPADPRQFVDALRRMRAEGAQVELEDRAPKARRLPWAGDVLDDRNQADIDAHMEERALDDPLSFVDEELEKAELSEPLGHDHTRDQHDEDAERYEQVRRVFYDAGYEPQDFELGGRLYGLSTNQLIDQARERELVKAGPYIGPRGGKWADPQHTIPWHEPSPSAPAKPAHPATKIVEDEELDAHRVEPLHEVRDESKLESLVERMRESGWKGPPLVVADVAGTTQAFTGSHRLAAAQEAGIKVPVVNIPIDDLSEEDFSEFQEARDDDERAEVLRRVLGATHEATLLMHYEAEKPDFDAEMAKAQQLGLFEQPARPAAKPQVYYGPKGGKYEDPQHKIPYKERKGRAKPKKELKTAKPHRLTYREAVEQNLKHMGTPEHEWSAVEIKGMSLTEGEGGRDVMMPDFVMPAGYEKAPTLYPMGTLEASCELCGAGIKNVYHIQNDRRKWTLGVGSECVTRFGPGESGEALAKRAQYEQHQNFHDEVRQAAEDLKTDFSRRSTDHWGRLQTRWIRQGIESVHRRLVETLGKTKRDSPAAALTRWVKTKGPDARALLKEVQEVRAKHNEAAVDEWRRDRVRAASELKNLGSPDIQETRTQRHVLERRLERIDGHLRRLAEHAQEGHPESMAPEK